MNRPAEAPTGDESLLTQLDADSIKALGGEAKVRAVLGSLWRAVKWGPMDAWWWYSQAQRLDRGADITDERKKIEDRIDPATELLEKLDNLEVPRSVLAPLESFLVNVRLWNALATGYAGLGAPMTRKNRIRAHLLHSGMKPMEVARLELAWVEPLLPHPKRRPWQPPDKDALAKAQQDIKNLTETARPVWQNQYANTSKGGKAPPRR